MSLDTSSPVVGHELERLRQDWWCFLLLGLTLVTLGTVAIVAPLIAALATVSLFGVLLIVGGTAQIIGAIWSGQWSGVLLRLLIGLLYVVVGALMIRHPVSAATALTLLLIAFLLATGAFNIVASLHLRFPHWGWTLANGFISLMLGIIIWSKLPEVGPWVIGLFLGIEMIFNGWAWIMLALGLRSLPKLA